MTDHTDRRGPEVITPEQLTALEESMRSMALEMPRSASTAGGVSLTTRTQPSRTSHRPTP